MEELQEADVLWPDAAAAAADHAWHRHRHHHAAAPAARPAEQLLHLRSAPVSIPAIPPEARTCVVGHDDDGMVVVREDSVAESGIVPPHVLAARRCPGEARVASSVCVGHGRTLKGRDLRAVRNAVLHMTGFLSTSDKY